VILAGYDDEAGTVHVVDASPSKRFRGDLPVAGFQKAWGSQHIPRFTWLEFQLSEPRWALSSDQARRTFQQNSRLMLHESAPLPRASVGLRGMRELADDLKGWRGHEPDQARAHLKRLYDLTRSVAMEREGHSRYLKRVAETLDMPGFADAGERLRLISQKWLVFRNLCLKGQRKDLDQTLLKLHLRLMEIASLEENALAELQIAMEA
jgi:hypothetical protein